MEINIDTILQDLKADKNQRTAKSLDRLNQILNEYAESGQRDFSITNIGRVSALNGGPSYESLRATKNTHYRRLIEAWATKAGTQKLKSHLAIPHDMPNDHKLLEKLEDPALRALFGQIIAERNQLRKEVNLLKQNSNVVIDRRPTTNQQVQSHAVTGQLTEHEIKAIEYAISAECFEKNGWFCTEAGQVKDQKFNSEIFPRGFITGLKNILAHGG